jgi:hypothetical protein
MCNYLKLEDFFLRLSLVFASCFIFPSSRTLTNPEHLLSAKTGGIAFNGGG